MSLRNRVVIAEELGGPEVIEIKEQEMPDLPEGGIRVAVRVAGLHRLDARLRAGRLGDEAPARFGTSFAGVIVESNDAAWAVGEEVIGWDVADAAADLVDTDGNRVLRRPENLDWVLAGGLPAVGQLALSALQDFETRPGSLIVVHGAAGGVGTVLIQLARARGLRIIATSTEDNQEFLEGLGAIPVVDGEGLAERIDAAADGDTVAASVDLLGTPETGEYGNRLEGEGGAAITLMPETHESHAISTPQERTGVAHMLELLDAVSRGNLTLPVEAVPFAEAVEAHRRLDSREFQGAVVLDLSDNPHL